MRLLTPKERGIIAAAGVYAASILLFWLFDLPEMLGAILTIFGVALAAAAPEMIREKHKAWRLVALSAALVGVSALEIIDASSTNRKLSALQLTRMRDYIRDCEEIAQEAIVPDPRDALASLATADKALLATADRMGFRASVLEAWERALDLSDRTHVQTREAAAALRATERRYRAGSSFFRQSIQTRYSAFRDSLPPRDLLVAQLDSAAADLALLAEEEPTAGLFGRMGLLAIARQRPEEALYHLHRGMMEDPEALTIYESLGYASWVLNLDSRVGLRYARAGSAMLDSIAQTLPKEVEEVRDALPADAQLGLQTSWTAFEPTWTGYIAYYRDRLALQVVYFSALELANENDARILADSLYAANPNDAEVEDALGFVLLRFARDDGELQRARSLFGEAQVNRDAEYATGPGAAIHKKEAEALLRRVEGGTGSTALADLVGTCR